jgi:hypothetical protein
VLADRQQVIVPEFEGALEAVYDKARNIFRPAA